MDFLQQCTECEKKFSEHEIGNTIIALESVDSTNTFLKTLGTVNHGTVVIAREQRAGRGKENRLWVSENDRSLTFSVALDPERVPVVGHEGLPLVTIAAAVSVADAVEETSNMTVQLKWPNDGLLNGKKIFGILTEASWTGESVGTIVLGIGINVNTKIFPDEIRSSATSIAHEQGCDADRMALFTAILKQLTTCFSSPELFSSTCERFRDRDMLRDTTISVTTGARTMSGTARSIAPTGALRVETDLGIEEIFAGDIRILS